MMYKFQQPEDQTQFCLPLNRDTEHLYYNCYLVIDAHVLTEPRVFQISKINRSNSKGIAIFTCAQDIANQHTLKADYDEYGNVTAWWADWNEHELEPVQAIPDQTSQDSSLSSTTTSTITCSGKPQFKVGGSAKTFTVTFYDENSSPIPDHAVGTWEFIIDGSPVDQELLTLTLESNKVKVKFLGDDSYIGKILTITNTSSDEYFHPIISELQVEIIPL